IHQLAELTASFGYRVIPVDFLGCLHLKSAATGLGDGLVLLNPSWVTAEAFAGCDAVLVDESELHAPNAPPVGKSIVSPEHFPRTLERLTARGLHVATVATTELAKAEGGVTCCSLIFEASVLLAFPFGSIPARDQGIPHVQRPRWRARAKHP